MTVEWSLDKNTLTPTKTVYRGTVSVGSVMQNSVEESILELALEDLSECQEEVKRYRFGIDELICLAAGHMVEPELTQHEAMEDLLRLLTAIRRGDA